jgi:hypothetical protein
MRRFLSLLFLSGVFAAGVFSQPKVEVVGGEKFDFGDIWTSSAKRLLTIKNRGTSKLNISNVSASCGCTGTILSEDKISPGKSGTLQISFDASRFSGKVEKSVSFETNDSTRRRVVITFTATVNKTLEFDPAYFYFSTYPDSLTSTDITVKNSSSTPIHILSITPSSHAVTVTSSVSEIPPGEDAELTAALKVKSAGTTSGDIVILTDHPKIPKFTLRFFALVKARK